MADQLTQSFVDKRQDAILDLHTLTLHKLLDNRAAVSVLTGGAAAALLVTTQPDFVKDTDAGGSELDLHRVAGISLAAAGGSYLLGSFMASQ